MLKNSLNCESSNLIYVAICQGGIVKYIAETSCLVKERINIYKQYIIHPLYQQVTVEKHLRTCVGGRFYMLPFLMIFLENKSLRKPYKNYFIDELNPLFNRKI